MVDLGVSIGLFAAGFVVASSGGIAIVIGAGLVYNIGRMAMGDEY